MDLTIVIPALDEAQNLSLLLPELKKHLDGLGVRYEILVMDGDSEDDTEEVVRRNDVKCRRQSRSGYGMALAEGFEQAKGRFVITMDADYSHEPIFIEHLWEQRDSADCLVASRYTDGGTAEMPRGRWLMSRVLNACYGRALAMPVTDYSSGFRLYRASALSGIEVKARDFDFLPELLVRLFAEGYRIREVPFHYRPRHDGHSHARVIRFGIAFMKTLVRMRSLRKSVQSADYDERAFDSLIPLQRYWQRRRRDIVLGFVEDNGLILDIGCGSSRIIQELPHGVGLDLQLRKLRYLRGRVSMLLAGSLSRLPFPDGIFQQVVCSEVIEHIPRQHVQLSEFNRILASGGTLVIGTPDYSSWIWRTLENIYGFVCPGGYADEHINQYTEEGLRLELAQNGFAVHEVSKICRSEMIFRATKDD